MKISTPRHVAPNADPASGRVSNEAIAGTNGRIRTRPRPVCHVCGDAGDVAYSELLDRLFGVPGAWTLRRCRNPDCGLLWLDPMPIEEDLARLYEQYFTHESPAERFTRPSGVRGAMERAYLTSRYGYPGPRSTGSAALAALFRLAPGYRAQADQSVFGLATRAGGHLLDVGCGNGAAMIRMRALGWRVEGVDFDAEAAAHARALGLDVRLGSLEQQEYGANTFDSVVTSHVLEHVPDPRAFLRECWRVLRPGGEFVCVTPNTASWCHRRFRSAWLHLDPPRHLHIFNPASLRCLLCQLGWAKAGIATSVANTHSTEVASRRLKAHGHYDIRLVPDVRERLGGRMKQQWAAMRHAIGSDDGEELVLYAIKE